MFVELPERAREWAQTQTAETISDVTSVTGGITNTKWLLHLSGGDRLVLRWTDPTVWGETGREHVRRESLACQLLDGSAIPSPQLLACDLDGEAAGGPADLLTWLPGAVRLDHLDPVAVRAWARLAVNVHQQPVPARRRPPIFSFRGPAQPSIPTWTRRPKLWRYAIDVHRAGMPSTRYGLLHRDFHFGNTLWRGDDVSGLIDWAETSWGPADLDVAHACSDIAMLHSPSEAHLFRAAYLHQGGSLDPEPDAARFWQVADILGFLPDPAHILPGLTHSRPDLTATDVRTGLEELLALTLGR